MTKSRVVHFHRRKVHESKFEPLVQSLWMDWSSQVLKFGLDFFSNITRSSDLDELTLQGLGHVVKKDNSVCFVFLVNLCLKSGIKSPFKTKILKMQKYVIMTIKIVLTINIEVLEFLFLDVSHHLQNNKKQVWLVSSKKKFTKKA